jgi:2,4-dienoyl-CoA reductase-like NADH-dependent reductase (Old Yellow Enzyme family)
VIVNDGFSPETAAAALAKGTGDAVAFGRYFIGNPDLVDRIREGWPLAKFDRKTLYTPGEAGYADYPSYGAD